MPAEGLTDDAIRDRLTCTRRIAVVGASNKPARASDSVTGVPVARGYAVTPVNPARDGQLIHGATAMAALDAAVPLDQVDIFRASAHAGPVVDEAIGLGARAVWMQLGVIDQEAAARARRAGQVVVMESCPKIEIARVRRSPQSFTPVLRPSLSLQSFAPVIRPRQTCRPAAACASLAERPRSAR